MARFFGAFAAGAHDANHGQRRVGRVQRAPAQAEFFQSGRAKRGPQDVGALQRLVQGTLAGFGFQICMYDFHTLG